MLSIGKLFSNKINGPKIKLSVSSHQGCMEAHPLVDPLLPLFPLENQGGYGLFTSIFTSHNQTKQTHT